MSILTVPPVLSTEKPKQIAGPTIHLNGTSPGRLFELASDVLEHLRPALDRLEQAAPNQRDYYCDPLGPGVWALAVEEHEARVVTLSRLIAEMETLQYHAAEAQS